MKRFTLTAEHVALLRAANVRWWEAEFGAPCLDPKRPYGNSDVLGDMRKILGRVGPVCPHCEESLSDDEDKLRDLHLETETALQVVLATGSFTPGMYEAGDYGRDWRLSACRPDLGCGVPAAEGVRGSS